MTEIISDRQQNLCEISWDQLTRPEWESYFAQVRRSSLLQSWAYGDAMARVNQQRVKRGLILVNGESAGLVQILEAGIFKNTVHGLILDRGPLWFENFGDEKDFSSFLEILRGQFPKRFGRRMRFIPEVEAGDSLLQLMKAYQFSRKGSQGYQTIWVDLRPEIDMLMMRLNGKWRARLRKAMEQPMDIQWDRNGVYLPWFLQQYERDRLARRYPGPSAKTVQALAHEFMRGQNMLLGVAIVDNRPIAAILVFIHGSSATYQVGFTSALGREKYAHHLLLWNAMAALKEGSVHDFDLGGVNDEGAQGVKTFKEGLGGQLFETAGIFG